LRRVDHGEFMGSEECAKHWPLTGSQKGGKGTAVISTLYFLSQFLLVCFSGTSTHFPYSLEKCK
jgi:hypothetical protein